MRTRTTEGWITTLTFNRATANPLHVVFDISSGGDGYVIIPTWNPVSTARELELKVDEDGMEFTHVDDMDDGRRVYETDDWNDILLTTESDLPESFHATLRRLA